MPLWQTQPFTELVYVYILAAKPSDLNHACLLIIQALNVDAVA